MVSILVRLLLAVSSLLWASTASAQKTNAQLQAEIGTRIPSGQPSVLTAASMRSVLVDMVNSFAASGSAVSALAYGAKCDNSTDDSGAINTALNSGTTVITLPAASCRAASTVTVPAGVILVGTGFSPGNPQAGTQIVCDLAITPCLQVLGGSSGAGNSTQGLSQLTVSRASGSIPPGAQGILVKGGYNVLIDNVMSANHYDCWTFQAVSSGFGLSAKVADMFSGACSDDHVVVNGWPELYVIGGRLGMNGSGDFNGDAFVTITGGGSGIGGPNTVNFSGVQFNQGTNTPTHWLKFTSITGGGSTAVVYNFVNNFIENSTTDVIFSDSGVSIIDRAIIANNTFNTQGAAFWNINAATQLSRVHVSNNIILNGSAGTFALPSTSQHVDLQINGNYIQSAATIGGAASSVLMMNDNVYANGLTINNTASGNWSGLIASGAFQAGSFTNNLTSYSGVSLNFPGHAFVGSNGVFTSGIAIDGTTPSSCTITGAGTVGNGETCTFSSNSNSSNGIVFIGTASTGTASSGTVTVNFGSNLPGSGSPTCTFTYSNNGNSWSTSAITPQYASGNAGTFTVNWNNNGTNLGTSSFYHLMYHCFGK